MITLERQKQRIDELLSLPEDSLSDEQLDELMTLLNIDIEESMGELYLFALHQLKANPDNQNARLFVNSIEAKAKEKQ
jgi:hypothetical protein